MRLRRAGIASTGKFCCRCGERGQRIFTCTTALPLYLPPKGPWGIVTNLVGEGLVAGAASRRQVSADLLAAAAGRFVRT